MDSRWLLKIFLLLFLVFGTTGCAATPLGIQLYFANGDLVSQITHADLVIFEGGNASVSCNILTPTNYLSTSDPIGSARKIVKSIRFEGSDRRVLLDGLPDGASMIVYILGLAADTSTDTKKPIAHGCSNNVSLTAGKIQPLRVVMTALP